MSRPLALIQRALRARAAAPHEDPATSPHPDSAAPHALGDEPGGFASPAGEDPSDARPTALRRGRLRKRLRYLERRRELMLRDLGGLVFEIHRSGTTGDREHQRGLVAEKVARIVDVDAELDTGRRQLREERGELLLREPGVGGLCPQCGEVRGSDARFCPACGTPVRDTLSQATPAESVGLAPADPVLPPRGASPPDGANPEPGGGEAAERPTRIIRPGAEAHEDRPAEAPEPGARDAARTLRASEQRAS